jgi:hypothetical protein
MQSAGVVSGDFLNTHEASPQGACMMMTAAQTTAAGDTILAGDLGKCKRVASPYRFVDDP